MRWYQRLKGFLGEVRGELKRTTFPSRKEVHGTTTVVIVTVFIFAIFLMVVDSALSNIVEWIFTVTG